MRKLQLYVIVILTLMRQTVLAQEKEYIIPFTLTPYNNISVQAILNGKDTVNLMFHTAANDITLTEEATHKLKSLHFDAAVDGVKSWGGQENSSRLSKNNSLQIGKLTWNNLEVWEDKNSGRNTDGKFGLELFKDKAVEIDFDKNIIVIHTTLPRKVKKFEKLPLTFKNGDMFLEAECETNGTVFKNKFLLHSGYSGGILFDDQFTADNKISEKLKITGETELKDSYGHVLKNKKAILPLFKIGNQTLTDVPVGFFEGAIGRQKISIIGGDILKRFNIIIDAQRSFVYLKANHLKNLPYANI